MKNSRPSVLGTCGLVLCNILCMGCEKPATDTELNAKQKTLPKLDFHKPSSFGSAITRIRDIHQRLSSLDELPKPISYTVREVRHTHGNGSSHVHFELVDMEDRRDNHELSKHNHADFDGNAPEHIIFVDVFTELIDVVRWLPDIAADSDMPKKDWIQVEEIAEEFSIQLKTIGKLNSQAAKHTHYKSKSETISVSIGKLEALVEMAVSETS